MNYVAGKAQLILAAVVPAFLYSPVPENSLFQQDSGSEHQEHEEHMAEQSAELTLEEQIAELRANVARLESALDGNHEGMPRVEGMDSAKAGMTMKKGDMANMGSKSSARMGGRTMQKDPMKEMGAGSKMKGMKGMNAMNGMPSGVKSSAMAAMAAMRAMGSRGMDGKGMGGMMGMMGKSAMAKANTPISSLPGFPGASHIYHVGSTGFFLDHTEHVTLSMEQATKLNVAREAALLNQASAQRKIDESEQELWVLTGSDSPDASKIDAKVREIEMLRGDQRVAFIRAVGRAASLLTKEQRLRLSGMLPAQSTGSESSSMSGMNANHKK